MSPEANLAFAPVPDWEQLPEGIVHRDAPDVAVDAADRVYLITRAEPGLLVYETDGTFVASWGKDTLLDPHGVSVGPDGSVYCVDRGRHCVEKFSPDGELLQTLGTPGEPSDTGFDASIKDPWEREKKMHAAGPFHRPTNSLATAEGELYVSDGYGNARIHRFAADGTLIQSWGEFGGEPGQFRVPHSLCFSQGRLVVADRENGRLQLFTPDGELLAVWSHLQRPQAVDVDSDGLIYVGEAPDGPPAPSMAFEGTEAVVGRLSVLEPDGTIVHQIHGDEYGDGPGSFNAISGLAVDSQGSIYIAENVEAARRARGLDPDPSQPVVQKFERR